VHGFDEFFGYLYHLNAMEDPAHRNIPQSLLATVGPAHGSFMGTNVDDPSVQARWGKIGKQRIEDAGPLYPKADGNRSMTRFCANHLRLHRQGEAGQQAVLRLAQPHSHARRHTSFGKIREHAQLGKTAGRFPRAVRPAPTTSLAP